MLQNSKKDIFLYYEYMAEQGYATSQYYLGRCYEKGEGVNQDIQKAIYWYKKSAEQGDEDAKERLQYLYSKGYGTTQGQNNKKNLNNASTLRDDVQSLLRAANKGDADAQFNLGLAYANNSSGIPVVPSKAVYWYRKAAEQGHAEAQLLLGISYINGYGNLDKDDRLGLFWYQKSANQGFARAQHELGSFYEYGNHVEQDYNIAARWYEKAAKQGYAFAQYDLGRCYEKGDGVKNDIQKAIFWYEKAAEHGIEKAKDRLQNLYPKHRDGEQSTSNIVEKENKKEDSKSKVESKESKAEHESKNNVLQKTTSIPTNLLGKIKEEAIKRMIVLKMSSDVVYKFADNETRCISLHPSGLYYEADDEDLKHIKEFEEQHNALVYSVIRCHTNYGLIDNFLYVSSMTLDWGEERAAIENSKAYVYIYNHDSPNFSEFSLIGIMRTIESGLLRTL